MSGTLATYQGFPCRDVRFRRTRGWRADTTTVLFLVADFPRGFEFVVPEAGGLVEEQTISFPDLSEIGGGRARPASVRVLPHDAPQSATSFPAPPVPAVPKHPMRLAFAGSLVLAEVDRRGRRFLVTLHPLFCVSLETARRNVDGSLSLVRATLVDARYFYARGFLRRWSYNRLDAEGVISKDSAQPNGEPLTLAMVGADVASSLFATPRLAHVPARWEEARPAVELAPFGSSASALARLAQDHGAGELCLNLDNSVALYSPGEGRVGHCPDGKGTSNTDDLPPELLLDLQGTGQTRGVEAGYPPDFVVVVGGLRVSSVRLDGLDPVLVIEDTVVLLDEGTVRKLTEGKHGLAWLNEFVLAPQAYQSDVDVDPRVIDLLHAQAYRLWRIPGVEIPMPSEPFVAGRSPLAAGLVEAGPLERLLAERRSAPSSKGSNAHLLPLLDRAETLGGQRLPVAVEAFRFASVHREMASSREAQTISQARRGLARLRQNIERLAHDRRIPDPWSEVETHFIFDGEHVSSRAIERITPLLSDAGLSFEDLSQAIHRVRLLERIRSVDAAQGQFYERTLFDMLDAQQALGMHGKILHELAQEIVAWEKEVADTRDPFETPDHEAYERGQELRDRIEGKLRELRQLEEARQLRRRSGSRPRQTPQTAVFVRNLPRLLDAGARVFSARLGVVQTSGLSGQVAREGVPVAEATTFVPRSPLVTFGAVLRPRLDLPPGRVATGVAASPRDESKVPNVLTDQESYYVAAFKRTGYGRAEPITLDQVPRGQGVPIERPDLVELVPLEGASNRASLDSTAEAVAIDQFTKPDKVEARKLSVARPWPVNCDGVVAGVEIAMRPNGKGFVTTIYTGSEAPLLDPLGRTRVRGRRGKPSDAAAREGTLP